MITLITLSTLGDLNDELSTTQEQESDDLCKGLDCSIQ